MPEQVTGKQVDIQRERKFLNMQSAQAGFKAARKRLLNVNKWHYIAGCNSSRFVLQDGIERKIKHAPSIGDFVKIDIPGPGPIFGEGFDWVVVSEIVDKPQEGYVMIRLQPSPLAFDMDKSKVAHFFMEFSSTTLIIKVSGDLLTVSYHGRNEVINTDNDNFIDNVRNYVVGLGAKLGISYPQWENLVEGIIGSEK